jgi:hypothetical protein
MTEVTPIGGRDMPDPPRPLGPDGTRFWQRLWRMPCPWINPVLDLEHVAILCELMDERGILRLAVLQGTDQSANWRERNGLRALDAQIVDMVAALGLNPAERKAITQGGAEGARETRLGQLRNRTQRTGAK